MKKYALIKIFLTLTVFSVIVVLFDPFFNDKITQEGSSKYVTRYIWGMKTSKIEVGKDGLYNGKQTSWHYFSDKKKQEGFWKNGYWDGEWISYDKNGLRTSIYIYEKGVAKRHYRITDGDKIEIPKDDWKNIFNQEKLGRIE